MADRGDDNFMRYVYRGEEGEIIPREATHIIVAEGVTFVRADAFFGHPFMIEVICHENVKKIEQYAFSNCRSLRRVIMPGVKIIKDMAFEDCVALTDVECGMLEIIRKYVFAGCISLRSINLPSVRIVERGAFGNCNVMTDAKFGNKLESLGVRTFSHCTSLERITIPFKEGLFTADDIFVACRNLFHVDLVEGEVHETIAALQLEEWRNDMNEEIDFINQILPDARAGYYNGNDDYVGEKAWEIRAWIRSVLQKIIHYKAEHQRLLNEAATLLELAIWKANLDDNNGGRIVSEGFRTTRGSVKRARREVCVTSGASIVIKNALPFLQLKS